MLCAGMLEGHTDDYYSSDNWLAIASVSHMTVRLTAFAYDVRYVLLC